MRRTSPQRVLSCFLKFSTASAQRTFSDARPPTWNTMTEITVCRCAESYILAVRSWWASYKSNLNDFTAASHRRAASWMSGNLQTSNALLPSSPFLLGFHILYHLSARVTTPLLFTAAMISLQGSIKFTLMPYLFQTWEASYFDGNLNHGNTVYFSNLAESALIFVID